MREGGECSGDDSPATVPDQMLRGAGSPILTYHALYDTCGTGNEYESGREDLQECLV